jgi:hypothetical protein
MLRDFAAGDVRERGTIGYFKQTVFPANGLGDKQPPERLVGMNQRHAKRIGKVLLGEWKLDASVLDQSGFLGPRKKMQEEIGRALKRRPAAEAQKMLVDKLLLASREPGDIEGQ